MKYEKPTVLLFMAVELKTQIKIRSNFGLDQKQRKI